MRKLRFLSPFITLIFLLLLSCYTKYIDTKIENIKEETHTYCQTYADNQKTGEPVTVIQCDAPFSYGLQYPQTGQTKIDERIVEIVNEIRAAFDEKYLHSSNIFSSSLSANATLLLCYETYIFSTSHMSLILYETHEINNSISSTSVHAYHFDLRQDDEQMAEDLMYKNFRECASNYAQTYFQESDLYKNSVFENHRKSLLPENGPFDCFALTSEGVLFFIEPNVILPNDYGVIRLLVPYEEMQPSIEKKKTSHKIDPTKPMVALTFDDGPHPVYTNLILDVLEEYDVPATFFDLGYLIERYPYVSRREVASGCEVGSHSYDHKNFSELSDDQIKADVKDTSEVFRSVLEQEPSLFRPPYGNNDPRLENLIPMPLILWSVDTLDWKSRNADKVMELIKNAGNLDGKVILMHSIHESSVEATKMLVPYLLEEKYQLVTVSQMIELGHGDTPENGKIYDYSYFQ
ncbi:MAG: polysaccharide deacetylase family protein [Eubacterium sp.]|nr:polysaccharide deacetylase family protein [uncultured Schaedlerella sp.]MCI9127778.1 polysaccharide deacetylase family protein [Eubacterium sp.]